MLPWDARGENKINLIVIHPGMKELVENMVEEQSLSSFLGKLRVWPYWRLSGSVIAAPWFCTCCCCCGVFGGCWRCVLSAVSQMTDDDAKSEEDL
jgi:hypothetical protein